MKYWLSWCENSPDFRPLRHPPGEQILGWWCSGYSADNAATICALVAAVSEEDAWDAIDEDWPSIGVREIRFIGIIGEDFRLSDRFMPSDWMIKRGVGIDGKVI